MPFSPVVQDDPPGSLLPKPALFYASQRLISTIMPTEEQANEQSLNVVLSLTPETSEEEALLLSTEGSLSPLAQQGPESAPVRTLPVDAPLMDGPQPEATSPSLNAEILPMPTPAESGAAGASGGQDDAITRGPPFQQEQRRAPLPRWFSVRLIWGTGVVLLVIFGLLFFLAGSSTMGGVIAPDWGLASLRIGLVAALLGIPAIVLCLVLWRAHMRPLLTHTGILALVVIVVGGVGLLSATPLHRLQGRWFESRSQYGLALGAYQLSGDTVATNQDMARIAVEWAEQLNDEQRYGLAVAELQPVVELTTLDDTLAARARKDLIQAYLAWGNQAQQQKMFRTALTRYQALSQTSYCDSTCGEQVHEASAQALLGLAQQLTAGKQYDQAVATYQQLVGDYSDTPEGQEAQEALTTPQPLEGRLIYHDQTPAANFQVLLASQWAFDSNAQVLKLQGHQYQARTDATGLFSLPSIAVGNTYMIAWVDANGHGGTCITANNQPLYTVHAQPLRATDAGVIDIECI